MAGLGGVPSSPDVASFDDLVALVVRSLDRPAALIGQSMGGYVAMRVAMQVPELVTHLVLTVTSAGVDRRLLGLPDWLPRTLPSVSSSTSRYGEVEAGSQPYIDRYFLISLRVVEKASLFVRLPVALVASVDERVLHTARTKQSVLAELVERGLSASINRQFGDLGDSADRPAVWFRT